MERREGREERGGVERERERGESREGRRSNKRGEGVEGKEERRGKGERMLTIFHASTLFIRRN